MSSICVVQQKGIALGRCCLPRRSIDRVSWNLPASKDAVRGVTHRARTYESDASATVVDLPCAEIWTRRELGFRVLSAMCFGNYVFPLFSHAAGFKNELKRRRKIDPSLYTALDDGLMIYDIEEGKGPQIEKGTRLQVHYDCKYRGLYVVSSRAATLLGGNRVIAEPFDFVAGGPVDVNVIPVDDRGGGGLFSGASGPKPPPALSTAVYGMKKGGKRSVLVPPELGYGSKGLQEIPPDTSFELLIEVLKVF